MFANKAILIVSLLAAIGAVGVRSAPSRKSALICAPGGATSVAEDAAIQLAKMGYTVFVAGVARSQSQDVVDRMKESLRGTGSDTPETMPSDFDSWEASASVLNNIDSIYGRLDVVIQLMPKPGSEATVSALRRLSEKAIDYLDKTGGHLVFVDYSQGDYKDIADKARRNNGSVTVTAVDRADLRSSIDEILAPGVAESGRSYPPGSVRQV